MTDHTEAVSRYLAIWNEPDADTRATQIAEVFASTCSYTDPLASVDGREGVAAVISGAREQFAGLEFSLLGTVDCHHNIARFQWGLAPAGADEPLAIGFDVAVTDDDGRITSVLGFLDKVPAGVG